jgi:hypothetical protein
LGDHRGKAYEDPDPTKAEQYEGLQTLQNEVIEQKSAVEAPLHKIENIEHDKPVPFFSGHQMKHAQTAPPGFSGLHVLRVSLIMCT